MSPYRQSTLGIGRRRAIGQMIGMTGVGALLATTAAAEAEAVKDAPISGKDPLKVTRLETFLVFTVWLFM